MSLAAFLSIATTARAADPVSAAAKSISPAPDANGETEVRVDVAVAEGWHVNSDRPGLEFLIPTGVELDLPEGFVLKELRYPDPVFRTLKLAGDKQLSLFEGEFSIVARVAATDPSADSKSIVVKLRYQACNDKICLRPVTVSLPVLAGAMDAASGVGDADFFGVASGGATSGASLAWTEFTSESYFEVLHGAKPFVMGFSAEWCIPCQEMHERTYNDARVVDAGKGVRFLEVDATTETDFVSRVMESFHVKALPTTLFFDSNGQELTRRGGYISASEFVKLLGDVKKTAPRKPAQSPRAI